MVQCCAMKIGIVPAIVFLGCSLMFASSEKKVAVAQKNQEQKNVLRVGFFPNLTHVQAIVAQGLARQGKGWFERYLPKGTQIVWLRFNAGPSAMESLVTGSIDVSFVGPSPAINLYIRTAGKDCRLLSGAVKGGSGLVLGEGCQIKSEKDWKGLRIATPQFGNTQDIACRAWFAHRGIAGVTLLPTSNPGQLILFKSHQIDGAWTIEPWLSRLVNEGNGRVYLSDDDNWTTILVGSKSFCRDFPELMRTIIQAHEELSEWIRTHIDEAACIIQAEMKHQTHLELSLDMIKTTLKRIAIETHVELKELGKWLNDALYIRFLKNDKNIPLEPLFEYTKPTNAVK